MYFLTKIPSLCFIINLGPYKLSAHTPHLTYFLHIHFGPYSSFTPKRPTSNPSPFITSSPSSMSPSPSSTLTPTSVPASPTPTSNPLYLIRPLIHHQSLPDLLLLLDPRPIPLTPNNFLMVKFPILHPPHHYLSSSIEIPEEPTSYTIASRFPEW